MAVFSKYGSSCDINPQHLCGAVINVYSGRVALRNVTQLCKVPTRAVRELLDVVCQKQNDHHLGSFFDWGERNDPQRCRRS